MTKLTWYIFILLSYNCFCQTGTIKGKILPRDSTFKFEYLIAEIKNEAIGSKIDLLGNFEIALQEGKYNLIIRGFDKFLGLRDTILTNLDIRRGQTLNLSIAYPPICPYQYDEKKCPICQKDDEVIPLVYGFPTNKTFRMAKRGKVKIQGCVISDCDPFWFCKRDEKYF